MYIYKETGRQDDASHRVIESEDDDSDDGDANLTTRKTSAPATTSAANCALSSPLPTQVPTARSHREGIYSHSKKAHPAHLSFFFFGCKRNTMEMKKKQLFTQSRWPIVTLGPQIIPRACAYHLIFSRYAHARSMVVPVFPSFDCSSLG